MKKLTDEELSMVLSQNEAGLLNHWVFRNGDRGCVAGVVFDMEDDSDAAEPLTTEQASMSGALAEVINERRLAGLERNYPAEPEAMLDLLARAGL